MNERHWLCLDCAMQVHLSAEAELEACPNCGSRGTPVDLDRELSVRLTWQELRILVMWAERYAEEHQRPSPQRINMRKVVYTIADRIQVQHMDQSPLTLAGEITQLREYFGTENLEVHDFEDPPA